MPLTSLSTIDVPLDERWKSFDQVILKENQAYQVNVTMSSPKPALIHSDFVFRARGFNDFGGFLFSPVIAELEFNQSIQWFWFQLYEVFDEGRITFQVKRRAFYRNLDITSNARVQILINTKDNARKLK